MASGVCLAEALTLHGRQRRRPPFDIKEAITTFRPEGLRLLHPFRGEPKALLGIILGNLDPGTSGPICDAHLAHLVLNGACATQQIQACLLDDVGVHDAVLAVRLMYHAAAGVAERASLALGEEILASTTTVLGAALMREAVDVRVDGLDGDLINTRFQALRTKRAPCIGWRMTGSSVKLSSALVRCGAMCRSLAGCERQTDPTGVGTRAPYATRARALHYGHSTW